MKKHISKVTALVCSLLMVFSSAAYAHSGRTDSRGGHRDNKNASGLGSYHYHCGGYPAHLHPNGVCPYRNGGSVSTSSSGSSSSRTATSTPAPKPTYGIYGTTMRTFVKGKQVTTYHYNGKPSAAVIVAEDLESYGFDLRWVDEWQTLYITRNDDKEATGIPVASTYDGQHISNVVDSDITVRLVYGDGNSYVPTAYSVGGRMILPVDELKCLGKFRYDAGENAVYVD